MKIRNPVPNTLPLRFSVFTVTDTNSPNYRWYIGRNMEAPWVNHPFWAKRQMLTRFLLHKTWTTIAECDEAFFPETNESFQDFQKRVTSVLDQLWR